MNDDPEADAAVGSGAGTGDQGVPLADLAAAVAGRRDREDDTLQVDAEGAGDGLVEPAVPLAVDPDDGAEFGTGREVIDAVEGTAVVPKRDYCERCPHFAGPPEASCTHEGTTIEAFVGTGRVRLDSCPIVAERRSGDSSPET